MFRKTKSERFLVLSLVLAIIVVGVSAMSTPNNTINFANSTRSANSNVSRMSTEKAAGQEGEELDLDEFGRPILSGEELIVDTEHFKIHYTFEGSDAAYSTEFIDEVALALEHSWKMEIEEFGWQVPPSDNGIGGDDRYDVYIKKLANEYGHVNSADPLTCSTDLSVSYGVPSHMVLDSTFTEFGSEGFEKLLETMRGTVAHEFNHSIQFGYDTNEPGTWLWEATATWMEDEVYDDFNSSDEYIEAVFKSPDTCQLAEGGLDRVEDESHWYGEWLYLRYLSELHGHETIRSIWEHARQFDNYDAVDAALSEKNTSSEETFRGFSLALLTRSFEEGERYPTVRLEGSALAGAIFTPNDGVGQMAADYVEILDPENAIVEVKLTADTLQGVLVGIKDLEATIFDMSSNQLAVDLGNFDHLYLVVLNMNQAFREYRCETSTYTVDVQTASQASTDTNAQSVSVPNFLFPKVESLEDPDEYWEPDREIPFKAPAELIPTYIPTGYEFIDTREITAEEYEQEFDSDPIWIIPGGGLATELNLWGPCGEDFSISIFVSESPYETLDGWYEDTGYPPYDDEIFTVGGIDTVFYDYTDDIGPFFTVNFIYNGNFYSIDGTISFEEMTKLVESLFE